MIVADTSVWIDYLRDARSAEALHLDRLLDQERLVMPDLVMCEILRGVPDERQARHVETLLRTCQVTAASNDGIAVTAATNFRTLRRAGVTIRSTIDLLIGTFCIRHGYALLHRDRDFDAMEKHLGLRVVHA